MSGQSGAALLALQFPRVARLIDLAYIPDLASSEIDWA